MAKGGKREGAGRKEGSKDTISRDEIAELQPRLYNLMLAIIEDAERLPKSDLNKRILAFKEVAPYVIRKQPTAIDGGEGKPIELNVNVSEVIARVFGGGAPVSTSVSNEVDNGSKPVQGSEQSETNTV